MLVAVVGATGSIGAPVGAALRARGREVRALSRRSPDYPVDLETGAGLEQALRGVDVVIDASNAGPNVRAAEKVLLEGGKRLLEAERAAGVSHHVCISIVGIERVPLGYYNVKVEQEALVRESGMPYSIVRATQFHQLLDEAFSGVARFRLMPAFRVPIQPVDPDEVAEVIATVAGAPSEKTTTVAGPTIEDSAELMRVWRAQAGRRTVQVRMPLPGDLGRALRSGAITDDAPDHRGQLGFAEWLEQREG
jgi:uncharacterized protein YbjT (DUF2867 family)